MFHAPGAINLSLPRILIGMIPGLRRWLYPQWFRDLPKNESVVVICLTSHRAISSDRHSKQETRQRRSRVTTQLPVKSTNAIS
ncbi:rhodanese-like domain-containing protein [Nostoc sphaeroides]|uniref:Rhodanese domain n=1 Tax=Nostoc sphaeroides CCNUC1 TaxID=2653204 RepID=A0A5P8WIL5_9NOSO|nr:rhodanese-like domain-containing protein [Nostoc sphaeroides]QFS52554.1 Rhodanese domain [Nostoc sphaeroides CCNUC1]